MQEFEKLIVKDFSKKNHDNLFDDLKLRIKEATSKQHQWDTKPWIA